MSYVSIYMWRIAENVFFHEMRNLLEQKVLNVALY